MCKRINLEGYSENWCTCCVHAIFIKSKNVSFNRCNMRNRILHVEWRSVTSQVFLISVASVVHGVRVLGKMVGAQLVTKLSVLYGPQTSLPCSQEPTTCPNPGPDNPAPIVFVKIHVNVLIFHQHLGIQGDLFRFPHQNPVLLFALLFPMWLILFDFIMLIMFGEVYNHEMPHYAVFPTLLLHSLLPKYFLEQGMLEHPQHLYPLMWGPCFTPT